MSSLEHDSESPLKLEMDVDRLKTTATFEKWQRIIDGVLTEYLLLETFKNGMFENKSMAAPDLLAKHISGFQRQMKRMKEGYKRNYWPLVVEMLISDTQYKEATHLEKAMLIQEGLSKVLTDDSFYIMVYDDIGGYENHDFYQVMDQAVYSFHRAGCNIVVSRSRRFNQHVLYEEMKWSGFVRGAQTLWTLASEVNEIKRGIARDGLRKGVAMKMREQLTNVHFVGVIRADSHLIILPAKSIKHTGPGMWVEHNGFYLIAGYA